MKRYKFLTNALLFANLIGCAAAPISVVRYRQLPSGNRVVWVKDFGTDEMIVVDRAQRRNISDKIALMLDSRYAHKFSAISRHSPPEPEKAIIVTGIILDFGPGSSPEVDPGAVNTWMKQFGAGLIDIKVTVVDAATGKKLIDNVRVSYPVYENIDFFGWTRTEQTVNVALEKITKMIGQLKIEEL